MSDSASLRRFLATGGLVLLAFVIAWLGRLILDGLVTVAPEWAGVIERFGGWVIGVVVVVSVLLPLFRIYGVLAKRRKWLLPSVARHAA